MLSLGSKWRAVKGDFILPFFVLPFFKERRNPGWGMVRNAKQGAFFIYSEYTNALLVPSFIVLVKFQVWIYLLNMNFPQQYPSLPFFKQAPVTDFVSWTGSGAAGERWAGMWFVKLKLPKNMVDLKWKSQAKLFRSGVRLIIQRI